MILFCPSHAKLSSEIEILHVFFACGSQNVPISLAHSLLGGSVLLSEASARSTPRAFQPMTTPQAHTRQHSHHSIATAASIALSITGINSPCRSARATSKRKTPAEEMPRNRRTTHALHHASTLPPSIFTLPLLRTFLILHSYGVACLFGARLPAMIMKLSRIHLKFARPTSTVSFIAITLDSTQDLPSNQKM